MTEKPKHGASCATGRSRCNRYCFIVFAVIRFSGRDDEEENCLLLGILNEIISFDVSNPNVIQYVC